MLRTPSYCFLYRLLLPCQEVIPGQRSVLKIAKVPSYEQASSLMDNKDTYTEYTVPVTVYSSVLNGGATASEIFTYEPEQGKRQCALQWCCTSQLLRLLT